MPETWKEWAPKVGATDYNNPQDSIKVAAAYLAWLQATLPKDKQDVKSLAIAYNFGIGNVLKGENPPPETIAYADRIASAVLPSGGPGPSDTPQATSSIQSSGSVLMPFQGDFPLTQEFGVNPERYKSWGGHMGLDYKMPTGTPILATQAGTVVDIGYSPAGGTPSRPGTGGFGNWVIVQYPDGYTAEYAHLEKRNVKPGDVVAPGQVLGLSDHTGVSDFPHLHFGIRKDGKYIDPHIYLSYLESQQSTPGTPVAASVPSSSPQQAQVPVSPAALPSSPLPSVPVSPEPAATTSSNDFPWGGTPEELIAKQRAANKAPAQVAAETAVDTQYKDIDARAVAAYPQGAGLYQEYRALLPEQKQAWTAAHPLIRAMHLAGYDPSQWQYMEKTWGKGIVEKWANIPPYTGAGDDAASQYYHANPDVFLAKAWLKGRPEVHDDSTFDPSQPFTYDSGTDYETAQKMFGGDIWDTAKKYYTIPLYVKGGDNKEWIAFKTVHPEYDAWKNWWYANLPGYQATQPYQPFAGGRGYSSNGHGNGYSGTHVPGRINPVGYQQMTPPQFHAPGSDSGWKQWLALTEGDLKSWRR